MATPTSTTENWRCIQLPPQEQSSDSLLDSWNTRPLWSDEAYASSLDLYHRIHKCHDPYVRSALQSALSCLKDALLLYKPDSLLTSFNGGKDAVVILYLTCAALAGYYEESDQQGPRYRPRVVYFDHPHEFPLVREFCQTIVTEYNVDMWAFDQGTKFASGLRVLVTLHDPRPLAFVLGTRMGDPNAVGQDQFSPSSSSYMPPFMRVNPILEWNYGKVWHFLRLFQLPYCALYDQGYTSLGTTKDTLPCPALRIANDKWLPAYALRDWDQERAGRINTKTKSSNNNSKSNTTTTVMNDETSTTAASVRTQFSTAGFSYGRGNSTISPQTEDDEPSETLSYNNEESTMQTTAVLLIIGDEILKGFIADTNTRAAAKALKEHNVVLKQVVVVSDLLDEIVPEIRRLRKLADVLITSGGVGPTHDDVTLKSIAAALECSMDLHEEMAELVRSKLNMTEETSVTKMATLPKHAKLKYLSSSNDTDSTWPVLQCKNIFVLPGVPEFFAEKVKHIANYLSYHIEGCLSYKVVLRIDEASIVTVLNRIVDKYPLVKIGSYPFVSRPDFKTVITVEGGPYDDTAVREALDELIHGLPEGSVLRVDNNMTLFE